MTESMYVTHTDAIKRKIGFSIFPYSTKTTGINTNIVPTKYIQNRITVNLGKSFISKSMKQPN